METLNYAKFQPGPAPEDRGAADPSGGVDRGYPSVPAKCVHCFNNLPSENSQIRSVNFPPRTLPRGG